MYLKHKTFLSTSLSSSALQTLDATVNDYIGTQSVDNRSIIRDIISYNSFIIGTIMYVSIIVKETNAGAS